MSACEIFLRKIKRLSRMHIAQLVERQTLETVVPGSKPDTGNLVVGSDFT